jgi:signal transduction histidine kinase
VTVAPIENANDEVTHYVGFQRDVTERKRQEKLVNVLNRALRHNLRNGMNVILSRANELARSVDDDEQEQVDAIRRRARDLVALGEQANTINQTVTSETVPAAHDVGPVVDSVADRLRSEYPEASVDVAGPDSLIAHTSEALRPALRELGTNAIKHTDSDPEVTFELRDTARGVEIAVTDDGPGLPEEEREVLNRGYETELAHSSGLGLWFVNWVVTGASGSVEVDVDDGTTVTLVLRDPERGGDSSGRRRSTLRD